MCRWMSGSEAPSKEVEDEGERTGNPQGASRQGDEIRVQRETNLSNREQKQIMILSYSGKKHTQKKTKQQVSLTGFYGIVSLVVGNTVI